MLGPLFPEGCCVDASSLMWMIIVMFMFTVIVCIFCCIAAIFVRWVYKRRMRKKAEQLREKYRNEERFKKDMDVKLKQIAMRPLAAYKPPPPPKVVYNNYDLAHTQLATPSRSTTFVTTARPKTPSALMPQHQPVHKPYKSAPVQNLPAVSPMSEMEPLPASAMPSEAQIGCPTKGPYSRYDEKPKKNKKSKTLTNSGQGKVVDETQKAATVTESMTTVTKTTNDGKTTTVTTTTVTKSTNATSGETNTGQTTNGQTDNTTNTIGQAGAATSQATTTNGTSTAQSGTTTGMTGTSMGTSNQLTDDSDVPAVAEKTAQDVEPDLVTSRDDNWDAETPNMKERLFVEKKPSTGGRGSVPVQMTEEGMAAIAHTMAIGRVPKQKLPEKVNPIYKNVLLRGKNSKDQPKARDSRKYPEYSEDDDDTGLFDFSSKSVKARIKQARKDKTQNANRRSDTQLVTPKPDLGSKRAKKDGDDPNAGICDFPYWTGTRILNTIIEDEVSPKSCRVKGIRAKTTENSRWEPHRLRPAESQQTSTSNGSSGNPPTANGPSGYPPTSVQKAGRFGAYGFTDSERKSPLASMRDAQRTQSLTARPQDPPMLPTPGPEATKKDSNVGIRALTNTPTSGNSYAKAEREVVSSTLSDRTCREGENSLRPEHSPFAQKQKGSSAQMQTCRDIAPEDDTTSTTTTAATKQTNDPPYSALRAAFVTPFAFFKREAPQSPTSSKSEKVFKAV